MVGDRSMYTYKEEGGNLFMKGEGQHLALDRKIIN